MDKKIIAVSLAGVLISNSPWRLAHEFGMKELAEKSGITEVAEAVDSPNYFEYVEKAIEKMYPDLTPEERIKKRRRIYLSRVVELLKNNLKINREVIDFFRSLKEDYILALITTNNEETMNKILGILGLSNFFDYAGFSYDEEKDDKLKVFERLIGNIGKPFVLIENKEKLKSYCEANGIRHVRFDIDREDVSKLKEVLR
ncbi:MAG: HAD hydrolase-like protein [archaeon]